MGPTRLCQDEDCDLPAKGELVTRDDKTGWVATNALCLLHRNALMAKTSLRHEWYPFDD